MKFSMIRNLAFVAAVTILATTTQAEEEEGYFLFAHGDRLAVSAKEFTTPMGKPGDKGVFQNSNKATGITFNIEFLDVTDDTDVGFDDPAVGAERRNTLIAVTDYMATILDYPTGVVDIQVLTSLTAPSGFLAQAGTFFPGSSDSFRDGRTLTSLESGSTTSLVEIQAQFNFSATYNNGLDDVQTGEFDLFTVALHEFTHGLGVASAVANTSGDSALGSNSFTTFDELLIVPGGGSSSTALISGSPLSVPDTGPLTGGAEAILFNGPRAISSFQSQPPINTPTSFNPGSSLGHWQGGTLPETKQNGINAIMLPTIGSNFQNRIWRPFEVQTLRDLGYKINFVSASSYWKLYQ